MTLKAWREQLRWTIRHIPSNKHGVTEKAWDALLDYVDALEAFTQYTIKKFPVESETVQFAQRALAKGEVEI